MHILISRATATARLSTLGPNSAVLPHTVLGPGSTEELVYWGEGARLDILGTLLALCSSGPRVDRRAVAVAREMRICIVR
jgi:hypothetical protein